jgi:hypothetical protein
MAFGKLGAMGRGMGHLGALGGLGTLNAMSPVKLKLQQNSSDINVVACGDSTGNATDEFIYLWFAWLSTLFPAFTFVYYAPDGAGGYAAPTTVTTGSGANTFRLYNNSVSGTIPEYFMGSIFQTAFVDPGRTWDLVLWNHGKNNASGGALEIIEGELMAAIAQMQLAFTSTPHIVVDQYPNRDDSNMTAVHSYWLDIVANAPQISRINFFNGTTYVSGDYTDNVHLTAAANSAKLLPLMQSYWNGTKAGAWAAETPWLSVTAPNLLKGSSGEDYANFALNGTSGSVPGAATGGVPFGWNNSGTITYTQEGTIVYNGSARSQKMQGSGAAQAAINKGQVAASITALKGQRAFLVAIIYVPAGAAATVGRIGLNPNGTGGSTSKTSRSTAVGQGGWKVRCLGPFTIASDMTTCTATLYHDSAASPDATHPVYYQWANLCTGTLPRSF